jgi:hypothetical protein
MLIISQGKMVQHSEQALIYVFKNEGMAYSPEFNN